MHMHVYVYNIYAQYIYTYPYMHLCLFVHDALQMKPLRGKWKVKRLMSHILVTLSWNCLSMKMLTRTVNNLSAATCIKKPNDLSLVHEAQAFFCADFNFGNAYLYFLPISKTEMATIAEILSVSWTTMVYLSHVVNTVVADNARRY